MKNNDTPPSLGQMTEVVASFASNLPCGSLTADKAQAFIDAGKSRVLKAFLARVFRNKLWLQLQHTYHMHARELDAQPMTILRQCLGDAQISDSVRQVLDLEDFRKSTNTSGEIMFFTAEELGVSGWRLEDLSGGLSGREHLAHFKLGLCEPLDVVRIIAELHVNWMKFPGGQYTIYPLHFCSRKVRLCIENTNTGANLGQKLKVENPSGFSSVIHRYSLIAARRILK